MSPVRILLLLDPLKTVNIVSLSHRTVISFRLLDRNRIFFLLDRRCRPKTKRIVLLPFLIVISVVNGRPFSYRMRQKVLVKR